MTATESPSARRGDKPRTPQGKAAKWVDVSELDDLNIHPSMRTRINDALADRTRPRIA